MLRSAIQQAGSSSKQLLKPVIPAARPPELQDLSAQLTAPSRVPPEAYHVKLLSHSALPGSRQKYQSLAKFHAKEFILTIDVIQNVRRGSPNFIPLSERSGPPPPNEIGIHSIKTKKRIDNSAVIRNRASRRVFYALRWCIQRENLGRGMTLDDNRALFVTPNRLSLEVPMPELIALAKNALRFLLQKITSQQKGKKPAISSSSFNSQSRYNSRPRLPSSRKTSEQSPTRQIHTSAQRHGKPDRRHVEKQITTADNSKRFVLLQRLPTTLLKADVVRLIQRSRGPIRHALQHAQDPSTPRPPFRFVTDIHQVYMPMSMQPSGSWILETDTNANAVKVTEHLHRRVLSGQEIEVKPITTNEAWFLLRTSLISVSSKSYDARLFQTRSHFVRTIIRQTSGRVVLIRGLPAGLSVSIMHKRLARLYDLVAQGGVYRSSGVRVYDRKSSAWRMVDVEPVIKLVMRSGGARRKLVAGHPNRAHLSEDGESRAFTPPWKKGETVAGTSSSSSSSSLRHQNTATLEEDEEDESVALESAEAPSTSMFLVRLRSHADAQRLHRRLSGQRWGVMPKSNLFGTTSRNRGLDNKPVASDRASILDKEWVDVDEGEYVEEEEEGDAAAADDDDDGILDADVASAADADRHSKRIERWSIQPREGELVTPIRTYVADVQIMY